MGKMKKLYMSETDRLKYMEEQEIIEHCDINEYKFDVRGNPIHHLLLTEYDPEKYKQMQEQQTETEEF